MKSKRFAIELYSSPCVEEIGFFNDCVLCEVSSYNSSAEDFTTVDVEW